MLSIAVPKTLLSLLFLLVIAGSGVARAAEARQGYRFGEWTLVLPQRLDAITLADPAYTLPLPAEGLEVLAYWQDGSQRALALRFSGSEAAQDAVVMKSARRTSRLKGCGFGAGSSIKPPKSVLPANDEIQPLPDDAALRLQGSDRGLRRAGEVLVADLGNARVQITEDSPIVRLGEWDSADFCRFELVKGAVDDED